MYVCMYVCMGQNKVVLIFIFNLGANPPDL